jgi:hypothetical protein
MTIPNGKPAMTLMSIRDISEGEEVFIHYGDSYFGPEQPCLCASCMPAEGSQLPPSPIHAVSSAAVLPVTEPGSQGGRVKKTRRKARGGQARVRQSFMETALKHIARETEGSGTGGSQSADALGFLEAV